MEDTRNLNFKINGALGSFHKHHQSEVTIKARQPNLVFSRPGRKGYFSVNNLPDTHPSTTYHVHLDGQYLGQFNYSAIVEKFNIGRI